MSYSTQVPMLKNFDYEIKLLGERSLKCLYFVVNTIHVLKAVNLKAKEKTQ